MTVDGKKVGKGNIKPSIAVMRATVSLPAKLQPIGRELGTLAIMWGGLETDVAKLLAIMLRVDDESAAVVVGHIDLKQRLNIIKQLALVIKPDQVWYERVISVINMIDTHLCENRNRMFHDFWTDGVEPNKMKRIKLKTTIENKDGVKRLIQETKDLTDSDIASLSYDVLLARLNLNTYAHYLTQHFARQSSQR
jgi:hypothetical protein